MKIHNGLMQKRAFIEIGNLIKMAGISERKAANLIINLMSDNDIESEKNRAAYAAIKKQQKQKNKK